jgi:hypothetical protein
LKWNDGEPIKFRLNLLDFRRFLNKLNLTVCNNNKTAPLMKKTPRISYRMAETPKYQALKLAIIPL